MPGSVNLSNRLGGDMPRWRRRAALIVTTAAMGGLSACSEATACPQAFFNAVEIEVRDASTGAPAARGATGTIQDGDFVSPLKPPNPDSDLYLVAQGGSGVYDVRIQKEGYQDWEQRRVAVAYAGCGQPRTVFLKTDLEPRT